MDRLMGFLLGFSTPGIYCMIFVILLACGLGIPIPEDLTLIVTGRMVYEKYIGLKLSMIVAFLGVMIGDGFMFYLGSHFGIRITQHTFFAKVLPPRKLDKVKKMIHKYGDKLIFAARFMPGFRSVVFFTCGTMKVPFAKFLFFDGLAALISVPTIIWSVHHFGKELDKVIHTIKRIQTGNLITIGVIILLFVARHFWKKRVEEETESSS